MADEDDTQSSNDSLSTLSLTDQPKRPQLPARPPEIVTDLRTDEVRWHYKDKTKPNEGWKMFNGRDSMIMETKWRLLNKISIENNELAKECENDAIVFGGMYRVNFEELETKPIYWSGPCYKLRRGTWFFRQNFEPLDEGLADAIEQEHLRVFRNQKNPTKIIFDKDWKKKPLLTSLKLKDCEVKWTSIIDVTFLSTSAKSRILRFVLLKKGISRLCRGYGNASISDCPKPIGHLVFLIPGIGQKRQVNRIVEKCDRMRFISDGFLSKYFPDLNTRPFFLPVEWRAGLKLDGDLVECITLPSVETLRTAVNATIMDVMYYTSPYYRNEVISGLTTAMNDLYRQFAALNPDFVARGGRVSIVAHSLGSVIAYDILTAYSPLQMYDDFVTTRLEEFLVEATAQVEGGAAAVERRDLLKQLHEVRLRLHELEGGFLEMLQRDSPRLAFVTENLFSLGSPLAVFLAMRQRRGTQVIECKQPKRVYNIFKLTDPVAYRMEPLVHGYYRFINPLLIQSYNNKNKKAYDDLTPELVQKLRSPDDRTPPEKTPQVVSANPSTDDDRTENEPDQKIKIKSDSKSWFARFRQSNSSEKDAAPTTADGIGIEENCRRVTEIINQIPEHLRLQRRMDFTVAGGSVTPGFEYLSILNSHFSYWDNKDFIMFMLGQLFGTQKDTP